MSWREEEGGGKRRACAHQSMEIVIVYVQARRHYPLDGTSDFYFYVARHPYGGICSSLGPSCGLMRVTDH